MEPDGTKLPRLTLIAALLISVIGLALCISSFIFSLVRVYGTSGTYSYEIMPGALVFAFLGLSLVIFAVSLIGIKRRWAWWGCMATFSVFLLAFLGCVIAIFCFNWGAGLIFSAVLIVAALPLVLLSIDKRRYWEASSATRGVILGPTSIKVTGLVLLVLSILFIIGVVTITAISLLERRYGGPEDYNTAKHEIQTVVTEYQAQNDGALPPHFGDYSLSVPEKANLSVIDICAFVGPDWLSTPPDGIAVVDGPDNDNFDSGNCSAPSLPGSYVWLMDEEGNVHSICVLDYCCSNDEDGYQDIWP